jgi:protease inhibitor Inh
MKTSSRLRAGLVAGAGLLLLGACASTAPFGGPGSQVNLIPSPEQLNPVETGSVEQGDLPPVGSVLPGPQEGGLYDPGLPAGEITDTPTLGFPAPQDNSSFVTLNDINAGPGTGAGPIQSGALTEALLLGGWTVQVEDLTCRLNLAQTIKQDTDRYRASAPACVVAALGRVASWQLLGSQVQLYNDSGNLISALLLSGGRFVGSLPGGIAISMFR